MVPKGTKIARLLDTTAGFQMSVPKRTQSVRDLRVCYALIVERHRGYKTARDPRSKLAYAFDIHEQERHRIA